MTTLLLIGCPVLIILVIGVFGVSIYNGLVKLKVLVEEAWSGIDVQLKRRYDLIPNLVETVKGYASHEKDLFEKVAQLRSSAMQAEGVAQKAETEAQLTNTLKTLFAVAENYPQLRANENFIKLQDDLSQIENEIQSARRYYNGAVRDLNTKIAVFPNNILAPILGFKTWEFFEAAGEEKENVKVSFSDGAK